MAEDNGVLRLGSQKKCGSEVSTTHIRVIQLSNTERWETFLCLQGAFLQLLNHLIGFWQVAVVKVYY